MGIRCVHRRRGGLAVRGARAAAGDAGGRLSQPVALEAAAHLTDAFRRGPSENSSIEGQNTAIGFRFVGGRYYVVVLETMWGIIPRISPCAAVRPTRARHALASDVATIVNALAKRSMTFRSTTSVPRSLVL
jgi:hypothetical protein